LPSTRRNFFPFHSSSKQSLAQNLSLFLLIDLS
jgi:hypothetical protein